MENFYIFIHNGGYVTVTGDYNSNSDIVNNLGDTWTDYENGKYIMLSEEQVQYFNNNPSSTPHEVFFMQEDSGVTTSDIDSCISNINSYDVSQNVNVFYVNSNPEWFDLQKRMSLSYSLNKEKQAGNTSTVLWFRDTSYVVSIDYALSMLDAIELYAIACKNVTMNHIAEVRSFTLKSDLNNFDITDGYPEKLEFTI